MRQATLILTAVAGALLLPAAARADPSTICAPYNASWASAARSGSVASMKAVLAQTPGVCRDLLAQEKGTLHAVEGAAQATQPHAKQPPSHVVEHVGPQPYPRPQAYVPRPVEQPVDQAPSTYDLDTQAMARWSAQDYGGAMRLWRQAAVRGDAAAEYSIGTLYEHGYGVAVDYGQAMSWYQQAAALGYAKAQNNIGSLYFYGHGVPQDDTQAAIWYQKAADQHGPDGEFALAFMYENGRGVLQDAATARYWYSRAADDGSPGAKQWLAQHPQ